MESFFFESFILQVFPCYSIFNLPKIPMIHWVGSILLHLKFLDAFNIAGNLTKERIYNIAKNYHTYVQNNDIIMHLKNIGHNVRL